MAKDIELISLNDIIPPSISGDRHIQSIISATDPQLREVSRSIREAFIISRIDELPENVIDLLAWQWHVDSYEPALPITTKRELVRDSVRWHRKKGTKSAIKAALEKLDFVPTIKEWFEIGTRPHTFEVYGHYKDNDLNVEFLGPDTEEILTRVVEITKPARSKLIQLIVAPIPIDMKKHACHWDECVWGHPSIELHDWGLLPLPVFEHDPLAGIDFVHGFNVVSDTQLWDMSIWGGTPYRELIYGESFEHGIIAALERESTATWFIPYSWEKFTWEDTERYSRDFELTFQRGAGINAGIKPQSLGTVYVISMLASLQPYWDFYTWDQHSTWGDDLGVPYIGPGFERDAKADVQWSKEEAPDATWSKYRTWGDASWDKEPTIAGTCQAGTWIDFEEAV
ncbi:MAG: phage tail protein I [Synergistaceae bacterium]|nr:phage tail protein I [Synergistaceae bacterium]